MATFQQFINKISSDFDPNPKGSMVDPGPYEGIIKNNTDVRRTGRLEVFIPSLGGIEDDTRSWIPVSYLSPFLAQTDKSILSKDETEALHTYGFWASIPDPGAKVLVIFIEGRRTGGVVIGSLIDNQNNHMVPGLASSKNWIKTDEVATEFPGYEPNVNYLPVLDHNPKVERDTNQSSQIAKPVNIELAKILKAQGLLGDMNRGQSFSTIQREGNSSVYGWSTPGRSDTYMGAEKTGQANPTITGGISEDLEVKFFDSLAEEEDLQVKKRFPGHSFVMDDGDIKGASKLTRLRTSTGHQLLMDDSGGTIYVGTASGNAWIELNNNGDIDVYSKQTINMHTQDNFNIQAGGDINMDADGNLNIHAGTGINIESDANTEILSAGNNRITATGNNDLLSTGPTYVQGSEIDFNGTAPISATAPTKHNLVTLHQNKLVLSSTNTRVPEREPWNHTPSTLTDGQQ